MTAKLFIILIFITAFNSNFVLGQKSPTSKITVSVIPDEEIFVHVNSSLFFVGEYMFFKMYVKNNSTNELSNLSKVAYIELISEDGTSIFKHQLVLKEGLAQDDFFIPTDVISGNYKLIGYTNNMLAHSNTNFFQQDISIINPYRGNQNAITDTIINSESKKPESIKIKATDNNTDLAISLDKNSYKSRAEVLMLIKSNKEDLIKGNYSISVRKKEDIKAVNLKAAVNFQNSNIKNQSSQTSILNQPLPEIRGKLIHGKLISKSENTSVKNKKVTLSIPGEDYVFKVSDVSEDGSFYFNIDKPHIQNKAIFQVIGDIENKFTIDIDSVSPINLKNLSFNKFYLTPEIESLIEKRSIHNQIENAYYRVKPDTIKTQPLSQAYYGKTFVKYVLDEYTRFPTIKETMVEIVQNAWVTTDSDGHSKFYVREPEGYGRTGNPLLLLVDGIYLQSEDYMANFKASKVKSISILRDRYYLGSQVFQGVMIVETKENDFFKYMNEPYVTEKELLADQPIKNYFAQKYSSVNETETSHIPDYRRQLLWQPSLKLTGNANAFTFFTSDILGEYEIRIEGFTASGVPISMVQTFSVN